MSLTFPIPSKSLRQAFQLGGQIYALIHEIRELAEAGDDDIGEELDELHHTINVLLDTLNNELLMWQQLALTAADNASGIVRFEQPADALLTGFLHGAIIARAGAAVEPLTREQVMRMDAWWPVHRPQ